tara:strand:+ start:563 stop:1132 length:570 start_codon:yes stop_codon:yes gene_type:complete
MAISTTSINKEENSKTKREKILDLMEKHKPLFDREGVTAPKFIPRMAYKHNGELIIGFYPKEMYGEQDIYTEFCSRDYEPEDPDRTLYKWIYNSNYETEYQASDPHPTTGDVRYFIPVDELVAVEQALREDGKLDPEGTQQVLFEDFDKRSPDVPYDAMTLRDYAAIKWREPVSHKKWLNELITKNFKQ